MRGSGPVRAVGWFRLGIMSGRGVGRITYIGRANG